MVVIRKFIHGLNAVIFALLVLVVFMQVVARVTGIAMPWSEEVARFLLVWLTYLAGYITIRQGMNVYFDMIIDVLPEKSWKVMFTLANIISIAFLIAIAIFSLKMALNNMTQFSSVTRTPMGLIYLALPLGSLAMIIAQIEMYIHQLKEGRNQTLC